MCLVGLNCGVRFDDFVERVDVVDGHHGLAAGDAIELGELLAFLSDWLASDPNRLDASLQDFVGAADYVGSAQEVEELHADMDRFARVLLGYDWVTGEEPLPPASHV
jgi:hypothetical protein